MKEFAKGVAVVIVALIVFKVLDRLFIDGLVSSFIPANFEGE